MKILPVVQLASNARNVLANLFSGAQNTTDFSKYLHQARSGNTFSYDAAALQIFNANAGSQQTAPPEFIPLQKAPTAPHSVNSTLYKLEEVTFTQQELAKLRDNLLREGLTPKTLTAIEQLASHPHGATLGQLLALMNASAVQTASLAKEETAVLRNFADKIDSSGALGKNVLHLIENGRHKEAWDSLKSALATITPQNHLVFEAGEAALLCKAFGVSQATSLAILKNFSQTEGMPLTPEVFTALMLPAQQEILNKAQQDGKLSEALAKHLQPLIDEARRRGELERKAAEGADRRSKHTEILIRDKFMDSFRKDVAAPDKDEVGQHPLSGKTDAFGRQKEQPGKTDASGRQKEQPGTTDAFGRQKEQPGKTDAFGRQKEQPDTTDPFGRQEEQPGKTENLAAKSLKQEDPAAAQDKHKAAVTAKTPDEAPAPKKPASEQDLRTATDAWRHNIQRPRGEQQREGNSETRQDTRRDSQTLLSRLEVRHNAPAHDTHAFSFAIPAQPQEQRAGQGANPAPFIRQAVQQVEQGTLGKLANGGQRLELQLAPSELGAVTLILTSSKGGEISATIRSERSETAELVARHLDIIRVSLEEQGLKVDKLEVRHEMLNNQNDWQGMEQHNTMREEQERREHLERLRRLGRQGGNELLQARDVQLREHSAEISGQGLYLVA